MSRHYYFSNYDLLQEFPEEQSYQESKLFGATSKNADDLIKNYKPYQEPYEPKDLGQEIYDVIKKEFKARCQQTTFDPKVLFNFWDGLAKAKHNRPPPTKARPPSAAKAVPQAAVPKKMSKHLDERKNHKQTLDFYLECDPRDVRKTLDHWAREEQEDINISKVYREGELKELEKLREKRKQEKQKGKAMEAIDRLYPSLPVTKEVPNEAKEQQRRMDFMRKLITIYKFENHSATNFRKPEVLYPFWEAIQNKEQEGVEGNPKQVHEDMELYFQERCEVMLEMFYKKHGYSSDNPKVLGKFWTKSLSNDDKAKYQLTFESEENVVDLFTEYLSQKKEQEEISHYIQQKAAADKQKENRDKLVKQVLKGKEVTSTPQEQLAKPKDRMLVGKTLLELKKMHPDDKLLTKMLLQEFQDTRVAKHPLEYDLVDSDEENRIKLRGQTKNKNGKVLELGDLDIPDKMKAEEISQMFVRHLDEYFSTKNQELRKQDQIKKQQAKEDTKLRKYIEKAAEKYLAIRKRRFEEKVQTLNEFLCSLYLDIKKMYKESTKRNFPHTTYGESKRLKKRSFPPQLKRYFFACMKAFVKRKYTNVKDKQDRLAFWAPTSTQGQHTLNKRVHEQTRLVKDEKLRADRPETSVWDKEGFTEERQKIMMTFSDAKECTFQPQVGYRMPNKLKTQMRVHNWAPSYIDRKAKFEHFLSKFGENFKKIPKVHKFGIFKRAVTISRKGDYVQAYKLIAEHFDLRAMKVEFLDPERNRSHTIFDYQRMGIEEEEQKKLPNEDFKNESNLNILREVYNFIKQLEQYELGLETAKRNLERVMSKSDQVHRFGRSSAVSTSYATRRNMIKDQMCPLGQGCPSLQQRWPNSSVTGVTPLGAECMFAHHQYELKFAMELKAKRRILKDVLKAVDKKLAGDQVKTAWNPGGGTFTDCIGCGEDLHSAGSKGLCGTCQMRKANLKLLNKYRAQSLKAKDFITSKKSFKQKDKAREESHKHLNKKMGCLARASALCAKERYTEAFKIIVEAVEIIKKELEQNTHALSMQSLRLKTRLGLDRDMEVTPEQVFLSTMPANLNPDDPQEPQKLHMFATKTGLITNTPPDVNEFVNLQVERMYMKIEKALQSHVKDIDMMKAKIEKLEDEDDQVQKGKKQNKKTKMCPELTEKGFCSVGHDKCKYAHTAIELDLVKNEKKIDSLGKSIQKRTQDLRESKAPTSWVSSGVRGSDQYQNTIERDRDADIKRLRQSPKSGLEKARSFKEHNIKTIYSKDIEDLRTPVDERIKKKY